MKNSKPFTYQPAPDVREMLEAYKKKTGTTFVFIMNEAVREYLKKKAK